MFRAHSIRLMVAVCMAVLVWSCAVMAQDNALRKEVEALYAKWDQAIKSSDAGLAKSLLTEDYALKDPDGKVTNRAKVLEDVAKPTKDKEGEMISFNTKVENLKQGKDENEAIVEISQTVKTAVVLQDGQTHRLETKIKTRDTWVRSEAGWKLKYSEQLGNATVTEEEKPWTKYTSPEGRYSVLLPGQPKLETDDSKKPKSYTANVFSLPAFYSVGYFDLAPDQSFSVDEWRDGVIKGLKESKGTILSDNPVSLDGHPGRQLVTLEKDSSGEDRVSGTRIYKVEERIYMVIFTYPKSSESDAIKAKGTKFFDSFLITKKP